MWTTSAYLQEAIAKRNYIQIHNELCSIIHKDPVFRTGNFEVALHYIKRYVPDVIQMHDNLPFSGREQWNDEYWALVVSELMDNFSMERIEHVKQIGRHLHGWSAPAQRIPQQTGNSFEQAGIRPPAQRLSARPSYQPGRRSASSGTGYPRSTGTTQKKIGAAAIAAGVVIAGTAAIGFKKAILVAGAAALIGGAYLILKSRYR